MNIHISVGAETLSGRPYVRLIREAASAAVAALSQRAWKSRHATRRYEIAIAIASPRRLHDLNLRYRKKDRPTDVLAFPLWELHPGEDSVHIGDVCLCPEVAKKYAEKAGHSLRHELRTLAVHGVLHLFGYDHEGDAREARRMFRLQNKILETL